MRSSFTVKFFTEVDMTDNAFVNELDSTLDFTTISHYELKEA